MQLLFILKVVASFCDMPAILDSLLLFEELSLCDLLQGIEVLFMYLVALDAWLFEAVGGCEKFLNAEGVAIGHLTANKVI